MSINAALQPPIVGTHLLSLAVLVGVAHAFGSKPWASAAWIITVCTSGIAALGLGGLLLIRAGARNSDAVILPLSPTGPFAVSFFLYLSIFAAALVFKNRYINFGVAAWSTALLGLIVFHVTFLALPSIAGTSIVVHVQTADGQPVPKALFTYRTEFNLNPISKVADEQGQLLLCADLGDAIDGEFVPSLRHGRAQLYITAAKDGHPRMINRRWWTPFGTSKITVCYSFYGNFDDLREHSATVYLPRVDQAEVLPYASLGDSVTRLREALQAKRWVNAKISASNLESYRQLARFKQVCDDFHASSDYNVRQVFGELALVQASLEAVLKELLDPALDPITRDNGLKQMSSILQIPAPEQISWQEKHALLRARLDANKEAITIVLKPL